MREYSCRFSCNPDKVFIILAALISAAAVSCGDEGPGQMPPPRVQVYVTKETNVPIYQEFVGQTLGFKDIDIRARVQGYLEGIFFEEGSDVRKGQLLYTIESQPFEENVAAKESELAAARVNLANAESDLGRIKPLAAENAISEIDLDAAQARYDASIEAVKAAEANLKAAQIELSYTRILSPIDGVIGKTQAKEGDFVGASPNPVNLNTVSAIETMLVQFFVTESQYLRAAKRLIEETDMAQEGESGEEPADLVLILSDNTVYQYRGKFDFIDRGLDPDTGGIMVQASFPNPNQLLRPGLFAKVRVKVEEVPGAILVPQRSVVELQGTFNVLVVNDKNTVENRRINAGSTIKDFWLVKEGLAPGERVIYEGLQKVKEGQTVVPETVDIQIPDLNSI